MEIMDDERDVIYSGVGPLAAILVGMALVPFCDLTTASNFTFGFLALIILVAEHGALARRLLPGVTFRTRSRTGRKVTRAVRSGPGYLLGALAL
jgi:hypothetical protein